MGPFDDDFQRRMLLEESMQRSFLTNEAARRTLADFDAVRHARELAERSVLTTNVRDQFERSQMDQALTQYRLAFSESSGFTAAIEKLQNVEMFRSVDRFTNLKHLAEGFPSQLLRDQILTAAERYRSNFTLPDASAIEKLTQESLALKDLHSPAVDAMKAMHSPWLDRNRIFESANAFSHLQLIGAGVRSHPFELEFTTSLRSRFGDWRDVTTVPPAILYDAVARTDFYIERGFDSSLIEFPEDAFEEATDLAGLLSEVGEDEGVDLDLHDRCYRHIARAEYKLRQHIHRVMTGQFGVDWHKRMPPEITDRWEETKQKRLKEEQPEQPTLIAYSELSDLQLIIERKDHFDFFKPIFRSKASAQEAFRRLIPVRHAVMHVGVVTQLDVLTVSAETLRILCAVRDAEEDV